MHYFEIDCPFVYVDYCVYWASLLINSFQIHLLNYEGGEKESRYVAAVMYTNILHRKVRKEN